MGLGAAQRRLKRPTPTRRHEEAVLKEIVELADHYGRSIRTALRLDIAPEDAILRQASPGNYNLIVMGVGRQAGETLFFGQRQFLKILTDHSFSSRVDLLRQTHVPEKWKSVIRRPRLSFGVDLGPAKLTSSFTCASRKNTSKEQPMTDAAMDKSSRPEATIEISLGKLQQLFNSFDPSPFHDRDLDHDADEYSSAGLRKPRCSFRSRGHSFAAGPATPISPALERPYIITLLISSSSRGALG